MFKRGIFVLVVILIFVSSGSGDEKNHDFRSVKTDLLIPPLAESKPGPGIRTKIRNLDNITEVYSVLYLPRDWKPNKKFPIIVEYAGNGPYHNKYGDISTGLVEDSKLGYGLSGGEGYIWLCLPYLNSKGTKNVRKWWGDAPDYDPVPTVNYCKQTVQEICEKFGGDEKKVILCGFSRGAIACNYIGLYDDEIAKLWAGFMPFSHYDGVLNWNYPGSDKKSAIKRISRLRGRPQLILSESLSNNQLTRDFLESLDGIDTSKFIYKESGFRNHSDEWILRPSKARAFARHWLKSVAQVSKK